jgi:hypothetical protein
VSPEIRRKLIGCLGMLGSDAIGERASEALLATRLLQSAGLSWDTIIPEAQPITVHRAPPSPNWRITCERLLQRPRDLSRWERDFVTDLQKFPRISAKQKLFLDEISQRILGGGA